jgi:hypothetical protein
MEEGSTAEEVARREVATRTTVVEVVDPTMAGREVARRRETPLSPSLSFIS